jgi:hypothetical protein
VTQVFDARGGLNARVVQWRAKLQEEKAAPRFRGRDETLAHVVSLRTRWKLCFLSFLTAEFPLARHGGMELDAGRKDSGQ